MRLGPVALRLDPAGEIAPPPLLPARQRFARPRETEIDTRIETELARIPVKAMAGRRLAVTVGSRGIAGLPAILRALLRGLEARGAEPFIVPAMGSHGGATTEGQRSVLAGYGITEQSMGVPIRASMETVEAGYLDDGTPLFIDRIAVQADGIVLVNKIKPHADFKGPIESGLLKMLAIGLGKHRGAVTLHRHGFECFDRLLPEAGAALLGRLNIVFGLAILENAFDELMRLEIIQPQEIPAREAELLDLAKANIGRLLMPRLDVLVIRRIGKDISGEGMDPNVTGRPGSGLAGFDAPPIARIVVLGVTPRSHGNGVGIGGADLTTRACAESLDLGAMYTNAVTAGLLLPAKLPLIAETEREALAIALRTTPRIATPTARVAVIDSTLELEHLWVSPQVLADMAGRSDIAATGPEIDIPFDAAGRLALPEPPRCA